MDRFVAIVFPTNYKRIITERTSLVMVLGSWIPLIVLNLHDIVAFKLGKLEVCIHIDTDNIRASGNVI